MTIRHLNQIELAARLNISPRTLERWRWTGEGPRFMKVGGRVVYRLEDVEGYEDMAPRPPRATGRCPLPAPRLAPNSR